MLNKLHSPNYLNMIVFNVQNRGTQFQFLPIQKDPCLKYLTDLLRAKLLA
jgi:hypothetical protein